MLEPILAAGRGLDGPLLLDDEATSTDAGASIVPVGARIDLLPVRERIFDIYREVAVPLLPEPRLWGVWTPRQIFRHVRSQRPASALSDLTDFVEDSYF